MIPLKKNILFNILFLLSLSLSAQTVDLSALEQTGFYIFDKALEAPEISFQNPEGEKLTLHSFLGEVILLNFWATWCPPCRAEIPSLERLNRSMEGYPFQMIALNLQEPWTTVRDFLETNNSTLPVYLDIQGDAGRKFGIEPIPTTYLLNKDGYIIAGIQGSFEWDLPRIAEILKQLGE